MRRKSEVSDETIICTIADSFVSNREIAPSSLSYCTHEEADTRMLLHALSSSNEGHKKILIRSSDTDVLVLAVSLFQKLSLEELWIASGTGKHFKYLPVHEISASLGPVKSKGLLFFHAFTGCDTTSSFLHIGKRTAWTTAALDETIWDTLALLSEEPTTISDEAFRNLERFVILMDDKHSSKYDVDAARRRMVALGRSIERIPPTKGALLQHIKRAVYQAGYVWSCSLTPTPQLPCATSWGWKKEDNKLLPLWTLLPEASKGCREFMKCGCTTRCAVRARCRCYSEKLGCAEFCACQGECENEHKTK